MRVIFYGLKRSGNHAIIYWLIRNICSEIKEVVPLYVHMGSNIVFFNDISTGMGAMMIAKDRWQLRQNIFISVEDSSDWEPSGEFADLLGPEEFKKVYIVRDPLNCYASRVRTFGLMPTQQFVDQYRRFVLGMQRNPEIIYYNMWNSKKEYRDKVSERFGLRNLDIYDIKTREGGGCFFEDSRYNERYKEVPQDIAHEISLLLDGIVHNVVEEAIGKTT